MTDQYSETVAAHYAAYRPPLHRRILNKAFGNLGRLSDGLDVGCGTGRSSVALAEFCERVYGVDPSESMLDAAMSHEAITYLRGSAENIPLPEHSIDIATFAGSLSYANLNEAVEEITRVCRHDALVVTYDFSVLFDDVLHTLGFTAHASDSTYDHRAGFSGIASFIEIQATQERIEFDIEAPDLAHILLADASRLDAFVRRFGTMTPHSELAQELGSSSPSMRIEADIFYSLYQLGGARGNADV